MVDVHTDDTAVDIFAVAMKKKLKYARERKNRGGWERCSVLDLKKMLLEHVDKGDMRDVANIAMMIWHNQRALGAIPPAKEQRDE